jgi:hypothetical protein
MADEDDLPASGTAARARERLILRWRLSLLGLSVAGSVAAIVSLLSGHWSLALCLLLATVAVLGGLLLRAVP